MNSKFLNTALGSYLKIFITAILTLFLAELTQGYNIFTMDMAMVHKLIVTGLLAVLPVILNALNKQDKRYGKKKNY